MEELVRGFEFWEKEPVCRVQGPKGKGGALDGPERRFVERRA
jgi:hypothetical protein